MASTPVQTATEPTLEQVAIATKEATGQQLVHLAEIEQRAKDIAQELEDWLTTLRSIADGVGDDDTHAAELVGSVACELDAARDEIRRVRGARGIPAIRTWLFYRIHLLKGVGYYADDVNGEDEAMHRGLVAVEHAIATDNPELVGAINRGEDDDRPELMDRAEAVLTKLIESGWRP